jgi:rod shape-determining protein MreD
MKRDPRPPLGQIDTGPRAVWLAPLTVMLGSLMTILPFVATFPILPPFGLMLLLAWRMRRPGAFKSWTPLPLGAFDDLVSGQPLGSAMLLWTLAHLVLDAVDTRLVWRDLWRDWLLASTVIGAVLIGGRLIATRLGAHVEAALLLQILAATAAWPFIVRLTAALDPRAVR